ncbi:MAG TPA: transporter substrate-binding domain-containing protein [Smithellaceae bacterium]|nr:transporter substrate-binding domain-containing protein [Smithellaceae bacterium]HRV44610.1 transporter substrate-binding domain-containing protein [Smithellaceae bacterium]
MKKECFHLLRRVPFLAVIFIAAFLTIPACPSWAEPATQASEDNNTPHLRSLAIANEVRLDDFDQLLEKRMIRVLVPQSRTLYWIVSGKEQGLIGDTVREFERYLNKKYAGKLKKRPLTVVIIPRTRDLLLGDVAGGLGDIAAGDITVTEERLKIVDFAAPTDRPGVSEILVAAPSSPAVGTLDDLAGKTVHVRKASSYYESLTLLNERLIRERKKPVRIILVPDALEDEDLLEMLQAKIFEFIVADDWVAKLWAEVLTGITVREDIVIRSKGRIGWAIRKNSPQLKSEIMDFYRNVIKKRGLIEDRIRQYHRNIEKIKDPTGTGEWKRFEQTLNLFRKYGNRYQFDPLMLAAQGFQESRLDQSKRSRVGAIGIMQIMPKTGRLLKVGDIRITEPNIHAGAKYLDLLMTNYFSDACFSDQDRSLFAFASYNAGPGKISRMRMLAKQRGLDPNRWFNHVELVTAEKVGFETTTYVRNIYKYYVAYKLTIRSMEEKQKILEQAVADPSRKP